MTESVVHIAAKQMMLRDLRGHLDDWEEGKYTFLDLRDVHRNLWNVFVYWERYYNAAKSELAKPEQLPLFDPPGTGSVGVNF